MKGAGELSRIRWIGVKRGRMVLKCSRRWDEIRGEGGEMA